MFPATPNPSPDRKPSPIRESANKKQKVSADESKDVFSNIEDSSTKPTPSSRSSGKVPIGSLERPNTPKILGFPVSIKIQDFRQIGCGRYTTVYEEKNGDTDRVLKVGTCEKSRREFEREQDVQQKFRTLLLDGKLDSTLEDIKVSRGKALEYFVATDSTIDSEKMLPNHFLASAPRIKGGDLFSKIEQLLKLRESNQVTDLIMYQIVAGLRDAACMLAIFHDQSCQLLHHDIKPENIMVGEAGGKLVDFGGSIFLDKETASTREYRATKEYKAPEVMPNNPHGLASDVYSLGKSMLFSIFGFQPIKDNQIRKHPIIWNHAIHAIKTISKDEIARLYNLANSMIENEASARPSAIEVAILLDKICEQLKLEERGVSARITKTPWSSDRGVSFNPDIHYKTEGKAS